MPDTGRKAGARFVVSLILLSFLGVLVSVPMVATAANTFVQKCNGSNSCVMATQSTVGNVVLIGTMVDNCDANPATPSLTTSSGTITFTDVLDGTVQSNSNTLACTSTYRWQTRVFTGYIAVASGPGGYTLSCTACIKMQAEEVSGISPTLGSSSTGSGSSASASVTSYSPTANDYIFAIVSACGSSTYTQGAGYTLGASQNGADTCTGATVVAGLGGEYIVNYAGGATTSPFTLGTSRPWYELSASFGSRVTDTVTITVDNSGTQGSALTISGCHPSPTTIAMDGAGHAIVLDPSCSVTYTRPADGANSRYRFAGESTTWSYTTTTSGGTESKSNTIYFELGNTYCAVPTSPSTYDAILSITVKSTQSGTAATTIATDTTANGGSTVCSSLGYSDYNRAVTWTTPIADGANQAWTTLSTIPTPTTAGNTYYGLYFRQITKTMKIVATSPATFDAGRTIKITGPVNGMKSVLATFTPANGDASKTASITFDYNNFIDCEASTGGAASTVWISNTTETGVLTAAGGTVTCGYTEITGGGATTTTTTSTATSTATTTSTATSTTNRYIPEVQTSPWFGPLYGFGIIGVGLVGFILAMRRMRGWDRR